MELCEKKLRGELAYNLNGGNAHMDFEELTKDFPLHFINSKVQFIPYSPWHFLEHIRIAQWDILQFITNPNHISPVWPSGYRPGANETADKSKWESTIILFQKDLQTLQQIALDKNIDLFNPIPHAPSFTIFRELLTVAAHNSYHIGEFALLRQALNGWPKERPYLTG